jgi:hypothetical protein
LVGKKPDSQQERAIIPGREYPKAPPAEGSKTPGGPDHFGKLGRPRCQQGLALLMPQPIQEPGRSQNQTRFGSLPPNRSDRAVRGCPEIPFLSRIDSQPTATTLPQSRSNGQLGKSEAFGKGSSRRPSTSFGTASKERNADDSFPAAPTRIRMG